MKNYQAKNFIGGEFVAANKQGYPVYSPLDGTVIGEVFYSSKEELDEACRLAQVALVEWQALTYKKRTEVFFNLRNLLQRDASEIAELIQLENGKNYEEAMADVLKAIELCEFATSIPTYISGRTQVVSGGIEVKELRGGVGIIASITPFNFPMMVPMWTIPNALVCGNAMILKPSEFTPFTGIKIAKLLDEAGIPKGIFQVINGAKEMVEAICDHPQISAITFVGSTPVAKIVYRRASYNFKRCLAMGGAKNHIIISSEVNAVNTAKEMMAAAFGMSGQRCMAASVIVTIGDCQHVIEELVRQAKAKNDIPPLITKLALGKVKDYLNDTKGQILVDGRKAELASDTGYYIGPSIIVYEQLQDMPEVEIFGPVLEIVKVNTLAEAIAVQNNSPYANGASIFTDIGESAAIAANGLSSGMIGVNIGIPVPRDPFAFGGLKESKFGYGDITGYSAIDFFTNTKKVTTKWNASDRKDWTS